MTNMEAPLTYAVTINETGEIFILQRFKEWCLKAPDIIQVCAAREEGITGVMHWQCTLTTQLQERALRRRILSAFPSLQRGEDRKNRYSVGLCRKSLQHNLQYCLKGQPDALDIASEALIVKGFDKDELCRLRSEGAEASSTSGSPLIPGGGRRLRERAAPWLIQLKDQCDHEEADDDHDVGLAICRKYLDACKTLPDKYQLKRYITTVQALRASPDSARREEVLLELVNSALNI